MSSSEEDLAYPPNSSPPSYPDVEKAPLDPGYPSHLEQEPTAPDFEFPSVPSSNPPATATADADSDDELDLDDLSRRFEELKKKK